MRKAIIAIIAIGAVVAIAVWWQKSNPVVVNPDGTVDGEYSVRNIAELERDMVCNLRRADASSTVVGSVVTSGGKARGDFDITTESVDTPFASHFILDNGTVYTWTSLARIGFRAPASRGLPQGGVIGLDDKAPYVCEPWNADLTRFHLPSGITFQEVD